MSDLSPELQRLVVAGRLANRPTDADRERVFAMLNTQLGSAAGAAAVATEASKGSALTAKIAGITAAALAIVAGSAWLGFSLLDVPVPEAATSAKPVTSAPGTELPPELPSSAPSSTPATAEAATPAEAKTTAGGPRSTGRGHDSLSEEVAILSRAQTELHSGRAESALKLLAEHERRFRRGILAQERTAAKIQALCALGRVSEANALLGRLSPQSLSEESARQACSSSKRAAPTAKP